MFDTSMQSTHERNAHKARSLRALAALAQSTTTLRRTAKALDMADGDSNDIARLYSLADRIDQAFDNLTVPVLG